MLEWMENHPVLTLAYLRTATDNLRAATTSLEHAIGYLENYPNTTEYGRVIAYVERALGKLRRTVSALEFNDGTG